jgi:CRISPR system Cascade subunit CasD
MRKFLLFRLYGPLASWGEVAVGEQRPSAGHPSKSAILGMLAAALGIKREQEEEHRKLASTCHVAVRVDAPGEFLRDYHTAQVPPARHKIVYHTRRDELKSDDLYTILSARDYRVDACYTVTVWKGDNDLSVSLEDLCLALQSPKYVLYLGRKSCPVSLPLSPVLVEATSLKAAFEQVTWDGDDILASLPSGSQLGYYWEKSQNDEAGMPATMVYLRRDEILSRRRWQYAERNEFYYAESQGRVK